MPKQSKLKGSPQKPKVGPKKKKLFGQEDELPKTPAPEGSSKLKTAVKKYFKI